MNEKEFYEDLQDFSKFFLSIEKNCDPKEIKPIENVDIEFLGKKPIFYKFDEIFQHKSYKNPRIRFRNFKSWQWQLFTKDVYFSSKKSNLWILKPSGLSRGRGLEIFSSLEELNKYLIEYYTGFAEKEYQSAAEQHNLQKKKIPLKNCLKSHSFIIQKYLERPLLLEGKKVDMRAYALVTHKMELFVFK